MPKKKSATKKKKLAVTDIKREYFFDEDGIEKVRCTHMNGDKVVNETIESA